VIDRATYLSLKKELKITILVEKDEAMLNFMSLIPANAARFWRIDGTGAMQFVYWLTAPGKGQRIIRDFGKDRYGEPMFFPNSDAWKQWKGK
jgi:tungstate transport system substrate-binding protein